MTRTTLAVLTAVALTTALSADLACAVSASAGSSAGGAGGPDHHGPGKPAQSGAGDSSGSAGSSGAGATPGGAPGQAPAACVPQVNDLSTSLFTGRILIRLPKGVELVEANPYYARMAAAQQATSCGAKVHYAAVGFFQQPANSITEVRDQLLELRGIPRETVTWSEEGTRGRNYTAAYAAAADPKTGAPPTRGWLVLREAPNDKYAYFALFETDEASFAGLLPAFQESGRNLLVKPRALQGGEAPPEPEPKPEPKKPGKTAGTIKTK